MRRTKFLKKSQLQNIANWFFYDKKSTFLQEEQALPSDHPLWTREAIIAQESVRRQRGRAFDGVFENQDALARRAREKLGAFLKLIVSLRRNAHVAAFATAAGGGHDPQARAIDADFVVRRQKTRVDADDRVWAQFAQAWKFAVETAETGNPFSQMPALTVAAAVSLKGVV